MIQVKSLSINGTPTFEVLESLLAVSYHHKLIEISRWIHKYYPSKIIITCGFRKGDSGCHGTIPCRALDLRSWVFKDPKKVCDFINEYWQYDPVRPGEYKVAKYHQVNGGGYHFHIQVHDNTIRRKNATSRSVTV